MHQFKRYKESVADRERLWRKHGFEEERCVEGKRTKDRKKEAELCIR